MRIVEMKLIRRESPAQDHFGFVGVAYEVYTVFTQKCLLLHQGAGYGVQIRLQKLFVDGGRPFEIIAGIEPPGTLHLLTDILRPRRKRERQKKNQCKGTACFHRPKGFYEKQK